MNSDTPDLDHLRARQYHQKGQLDEAVARYSKVLLAQPENASALHDLGLAAYQLGKHEEALKFILKAIDYDPKNAFFHANISEVFRASGNLEQAIAHGQRALELDSKSPKAYNNLGIALKESGRVKEAVTCLREATELDPQHFLAWQNLGHAQFVLGQIDVAARSFQKSIEIEPKFPESHFWLGVALQLNGWYDDAIAAFRKCLELKPEHAEALNRLGSALKTLSRRKEAIDQLRLSLRIEPRNPLTHHMLGSTLLGDGELEEAELCFREALKVDEQYYRAHHGLGLIHLARGEINKAASSFRKAIEINPGYSEARDNLRIMGKFQEETEESLAKFKEAFQNDPNNPQARFRLALSHWKLGQADQAIPLYEELLKRAPDSPQIHYALALAYKETGKEARALESARLALQLKPNDPFLLALQVSLSANEKATGGQVGAEPGLRVALLMHQPLHYFVLRPVYDALVLRHRCLISSNLEEVIRFQPQVVLMAESYASVLRSRLPGALFVWLGNGLLSRNSTYYTAMTNDIACVTSESNRDWYSRNGGKPRREFWVTGYVQMDPLFRDDPLPIPLPLDSENKTILYAPTWNEGLSSAQMLGDRLVELIRGKRRDMNIIIKPHPLLFERQPDLLLIWRGIAELEENIHMVDNPVADVIPYMQHSDLLISDASSVIFEFLALDRPIVLISNPSRFKTAQFDPGGIEWRWRDVGEEVKEVSELPAAVDRALDQPHLRQEKRAKYRRLLFGDLCDGRAAERIARKIDELALSYPDISGTEPTDSSSSGGS